jgi:hypothetical protein
VFIDDSRESVATLAAMARATSDSLVARILLAVVAEGTRFLVG